MTACASPVICTRPPRGACSPGQETLVYKIDCASVEFCEFCVITGHTAGNRIIHNKRIEQTSPHRLSAKKNYILKVLIMYEPFERTSDNFYFSTWRQSL